MELHSVQITNFRSIEDSTVVPIERVACLVGKNESGKTNFLQALVRLNPAAGQPQAFDINDDYPRRGLGDIEHRLKDPDFPRPVVITARYRLSEPEITDLMSTFGDGTVVLGDDDTVGITVDYDRNRLWDFDTDEAAAVKHLASSAGVKGEPAKVKTIEELVAWAREQAAGENPSEAAAAVVQAVEDWGGPDLDDAVIEWLEAREPLFIYFDDYARMAGEGNVRELLTKRNQGAALSPAEHTFLALIDEARIDLDDLAAQDYNALRNRLESASIRISEELYTYWSQNQTSGIDFDHTYEDIPGDPHGQRRDLILKVRVVDKRHGVSVPIDRRSNGFVWFFSFLVNFSQIQSRFPERPLVLLLDEPGTALHGLAQHDFLRVLDGPLAAHQILYTTHQPFLVDADRLDRARPVVEQETGGTKVHAHAYKIDNDTLFPLQAALGYGIGQTLFVAPNVLLVEGTSDLIYLQLLSRACEQAGKAGLDRRWTITPVGGIDRMDTFVRLFKGQQLNICALIDASSNKLSKVEKLVRDGHLEAEQLIKLAEVIDAPAADIEDLMSEELYLRLVQGVGGEDGQRAFYALVQADRLPPAEDEPRITRRIDKLLDTYGQPRLDHLPPALYFERHQAELLADVDQGTLERAEALFARMNDQLRA